MIRKAVCGLALAAGLAASAPAFADQNTVEVPITEFDLPNGLHVILHEDHTIPVVHTNIWYRVGSANEKVGRTGFAHLFEHLMFEGSGHVKEGQFDHWLEGVGGDNNASTSKDRTNYYTSAPSSALELPLFLESDRLGFLLDSMSPNIVDQQRDVVKNEMRQSYLNRPYGKAWLELPALLYPANHPYHWPVIGSMDDLTAAGFEDVANFFKTYYVPNNASLVISGDIDTANAKQLVTKWFSEIKKGEPVPAIETVPVKIDGVVHKTIGDVVELPLRTYAWHTPPLFSGDDVALDVLASILASGKNSRLYKRLIYNEESALSVSASQMSQHLSSLFLLQVQPRHGHTLEEMHRAVNEEIAKLQKEPPSQEEVERARNIMELVTLANLERSSEKADMLNSYYFYTGNPNYFAQDLQRYKDVTPEDISRCAKKYLDLQNYVELDVIPEEVKK